MAGKIIKELSATLSGAAATGYVTVASTTGFYKGAVCTLSNTGQPGLTVEITEVASGTSLGLRQIPEDPLGRLGAPSDRALAFNYGRTSLTAYNGGTLYQPEQLIYNPNDLGLS